MLLIDPATLAAILEAKCGDRSPARDDQAMVSALRLITPRVEDAMNVATLTRGVYTDSFLLAAQGSSGTPTGLRLSNGIVLPGTVKVFAPGGAEVGAADIDEEGHDYAHGVVSLARWQRGRYKVQYESGYEVQDLPEPHPDWMDENDRVLKDVPDWIVGLIVNYFTIWIRTARVTPKVNEKISYGQVDQAIRKEVTARIYGRYQRPRVGLIFSDRLDHG